MLLRPNPAFLSKVISDFHMNQLVVLKSFSPAHEVDGEARDLTWLYPFRALRIYIHHTGALGRQIGCSWASNPGA